MKKPFYQNNLKFLWSIEDAANRYKDTKDKALEERGFSFPLKLALYFYWWNNYETLELQRKAESYFQNNKRTFSSDTRQSMKRRIIAKHLTESK